MSAKSTLIYYIRILWEKNGLTWTSDNRAEIEGIVESLEFGREDVEAILRQYGLIT